MAEWQNKLSDRITRQNTGTTWIINLYLFVEGIHFCLCLPYRMVLHDWVEFKISQRTIPSWVLIFHKDTLWTQKVWIPNCLFSVTLGMVIFLDHKMSHLGRGWLGPLLLQHILATGATSQGQCKHTPRASVNAFSSAIERQVYTTFILKPNHILYLKTLLWGHIEEIYVI